ncbi:hypothetical protein ACFY3B_19330 [Micromonospora parva]|uniref:Uncharacterized protein n=1 Tax=Micromonospora parva TaxID=1464048 RepID=A0ABW6VVX5_9ACTN
MSDVATPGAASAATLATARAVALAALAAPNGTAGHAAARAELGALSVDQLLDVSATLAAMVGRAHELLLTHHEWTEVTWNIRGES